VIRHGKARRRDVDWVVVAMATLMVCVLVAGVLAVLWVGHREAGRNQACASHGWERADTRGGLCVDDDGVVRQP
jgi:hypothetical protein